MIQILKVQSPERENRDTKYIVQPRVFKTLPIVGGDEMRGVVIVEIDVDVAGESNRFDMPISMEKLQAWNRKEMILKWHRSSVNPRNGIILFGASDFPLLKVPPLSPPPGRRSLSKRNYPKWKRLSAKEKQAAAAAAIRDVEIAQEQQNQAQ